VKEAERQRTEAARSALALGLTTPSREASRLLVGGGGLAAIFAGFFVVAVVAGGLLVSRQKARLKNRGLGFVTSVVDFRATQLQRWLFERRGDALVAGRDQVLAKALAADPGGGERGRLADDAAERLALMATAHGYTTLVGLDPAGQRRFAFGPDGQLVSPEWAARARTAMATQSIEVIGLRRTETSPPGLAFDLIAPITFDGPGGKVGVGALVLRMDPSDVLTDVLGVAPAASPTGELSLIVGTGPDALFVHPKRRALGSPWISTRPSATDRTPEALLARGTTDLSDATTEAGVPILAAARPLASFGATFVAQIDTDELVGEGARALWLSVSLLGSLFLGVALLARHGWARRTREALRANQEKFKIIFETMQEGYILSGADGQVLLVNPAMGQMLGYDDANELLGKSMSNDVFANPNERAKLRGLLAEAGIVKTFKATFKRTDGTPVIVEGNVRLVKDATGVTVGTEGIVRDMTAHYEARAELIAAREAAEAAALAKSQFLANMSHEIRTPLNAIVGLGHLLLRSELPTRQRTYVNQIQSSARILLGTVEHVLDFSKIEAGKLELEAVPFQLDDVIEDVVGMLSAQAQSKGVALVTALPAEVPRALLGDPLRLGQVLTNLAGNALKFTRTGQVTLAVERVELGQLDGAGALLKFSVRDTGIGIAPEQLARIFEPFTQGDGSTTRQFGGTGLGLSISRQIVDLMGGRIEATSTPGAGSVFSFAVRLPLRTANAAPVTSADGVPAGVPSGVPSILRGARVLVAEDNAINQEVARELLEGVGVVVFIADNGQDAVDAVLASNGAIEAVLMDLQMPRLDGVAATRALRAHAALAHLPIIAMTAHALVAERERCLAAGMNDYVSKPFEPSELFALLARWLAGRQVAPGAARDAAKAAAVRSA
jgi:PAS domain S-box-containing protein